MTIPQNASLYIHWPFCLSKCPYCDFNSHVRQSIDEAAWIDALCQNLYYTKEITAYTSIKTIFFGGGTPSLMHPDSVGRVLSTASTLWSFEPNIEISLEANPNAVEQSKLQAFKEAGINRLSLGIQALNEKDLKFLGRSHSFQEALHAIELGRKIFNNFSFDLIYARPHQNYSEWEEELKKALSFSPDHLSLYQLIIEPNTAFASLYKQGKIDMPSDIVCAELYEATNTLLDQNGFSCYEVSNYATPNHECQHNLTYWQYEDYIGVGPGAHGRITLRDGNKVATTQKRSPEKWQQDTKNLSHAYDTQTLLPVHEQQVESLLMGLRLTKGVKRDQVQDILDWHQVERFIQKDLLTLSNTYLSCTGKGMLYLNHILESIWNGI